MEMDFTTMSSKGQVVIPKSLRKGLKEGDRFVIVRANNRFILKKEKTLRKDFEIDLEFARRTEAAWKRYENGEYKTLNEDEFFKEFDKWSGLASKKDSKRRLKK